MKNGYIFDIQRFCLHDGDGIRTTVFLKGCPLNCLWCHNPESKKTAPELLFYSSKCTLCGACVESCPVGARTIDATRCSVRLDRALCTHCGKCVDICPSEANKRCGYEISSDDAFAEVLRDKSFYKRSGGGMTISGGEPSLQADFTLEMLDLAKKSGISSAIETSGYGNASFYEKAAKLGATFLYDIKAADDTLHKKLTGVSNRRIIDNLTLLSELGADIRLRLPMIPTYNDSCEALAELGALLEKFKSSIKYAEIMPYHSLGITKENALDIASRQIGIPDGKQFAKEQAAALAKHFSGEIKISL